MFTTIYIANNEISNLNELKSEESEYESHHDEKHLEKSKRVPVTSIFSFQQCFKMADDTLNLAQMELSSLKHRKICLKRRKT